MNLSVKLTPQSINVIVNPAVVGIGTSPPIARDYVERDPYEGEYTITPSAETQVLATRNLRMTGDITVNPIPSNYGLITWNGAILTVS